MVHGLTNVWCVPDQYAPTRMGNPLDDPEDSVSSSTSDLPLFAQTPDKPVDQVLILYYCMC
jgi:hypothetical protein